MSQGTAAPVSLLVRRYLALRGPVLALNGVGQNIGMVVGTAVDGLALTLVLMTAAATVTLVAALPTLRERSATIVEPSLAPSAL